MTHGDMEENVSGFFFWTQCTLQQTDTLLSQRPELA